MTPSEPTREESLNAALADLLDEVQRGGSIDRTAWVERHPRFAREIEEVLGLMAVVPRAGPPGDETTPPASAFPAAPRRLGDYDLFDELGHGGMGVVYRALQRSLGRVVAVKLVSGGVVDAGERQRFRREAEAMAQLDHPGIVPIYEVGEEEGRLFLATRFLSGGALSRDIDRYRNDPRAAAELVRGLAEAVGYAHARGVLHRDLKPGNVLLDADGRPCVADFGLAKLLGRDSELTRTGDLVGTPSYMAPEQAEGKAGQVTVATDVYGLGGVLYALLTGRPPLRGESVLETLDLVRSREPDPVRGQNTRIDRDLETVCLKCLRKEPSGRYATAQALADDLGRWLRGEPVVARPVGTVERLSKWVRRRPGAAALAVVMSLVAVATLWLAASLVRSMADEAAARERYEWSMASRELQEVHRRRSDRPAGWTEDNLVSLRRLAAGPIAGEALNYLRDEAIQALAAVELRPRPALHSEYKVAAVAFSPDGKQIALAEHYPSGKHPLRVQLRDVASGSPLKELTYLVDQVWDKKQEGEWADGPGAIAFSPDGRWLLVGTKSGWLVRWDLRGVSTAGERWYAHPFEEDGSWIDALHFSEDGTNLLSSTHRRIRQSKVSDWSLVGESLPGRLPQSAPTLPSVGPLLWRGESQGVFDMLPVGRWSLQPAPGTAHAHTYALSRDGVAAVLDLGAIRLHRCRLGECLHDDFLLSSRSKRLPNFRSIAFSPGGEYLFTCSTVAGCFFLWDVAGRQQLQEYRGLPGTLQPKFRPDGKHLAVCEDFRVGQYELIDRGVRQTIALQPLRVAAFDITPDGRTLTTRGIQTDSRIGDVRFYERRTDGSIHLKHVRTRVATYHPRTAIAPGGDGFANTEHIGNDGGTTLRIGEQVIHEAPTLTDMRFGPDGRLWSLSKDEITTWSSPDGEKVGFYKSEKNGDRRGFSFDSVYPSPRFTAAGRGDGSVLLFDPKCRLLGRWRAFEGEQKVQVALSDDESLLLAGGQYGDVRLFRVPSGEVVADLPKAHKDRVTSVAFGPGGTLVTGSRDGTVQLRTPEGQPILALTEGGPIVRLAVSNGGAELTLLVEEEIGLRRWNLAKLHDELTALGIDPGFARPTPTATPERPRRGLWAEIHHERNFTDPKVWRIDPTINFDWDLGRPCPEVGDENFSIRWTGYLRPPHAGRYRFRAEIDDEVKLWLDGKLVLQRLDVPGKVPDPWCEDEIELPDRPVSLRLDFTEIHHTAWCRLLWKRADDPGPFRVVEPEALFPDREAAWSAERGGK